MMYEQGKSDGRVVPKKLSNKAAEVAAETVEGRRPAKGNTHQQNASRTQSRTQGAPSELERVRQAARRDKNARFTSLLHHVTVERLRSAYQQTRRDAAPGVDGVTWEQYGQALEENLQELHARLHRGAYRARPSRRVVAEHLEPQKSEQPGRWMSTGLRSGWRGWVQSSVGVVDSLRLRPGCLALASSSASRRR